MENYSSKNWKLTHPINKNGIVHWQKGLIRIILAGLYRQYLSRLVTKPTKWHVRPAKPQISLGIRPVWSESSLSAWRKLGSLATHWVHSEDSDQTGRMPKLIWVFAGSTCLFVGFVTRRLILCIIFMSSMLRQHQSHWFHFQKPRFKLEFLLFDGKFIKLLFQNSNGTQNSTMSSTWKTHTLSKQGHPTGNQFMKKHTRGKSAEEESLGRGLAEHGRAFHHLGRKKHTARKCWKQLKENWIPYFWRF